MFARCKKIPKAWVKYMKRIFIMLLIALSFSLVANAQQRIKVSGGLYLANYGNITVIEDDSNKRTISIKVAQEGINNANKEKIYKVVCGKWSKRVVKEGLKVAIAAGIVASATSGGTSLMISSASTLALYIYEDVCEYYGSTL